MSSLEAVLSASRAKVSQSYQHRTSLDEQVVTLRARCCAELVSLGADVGTRHASQCFTVTYPLVGRGWTANNLFNDYAPVCAGVGPPNRCGGTASLCTSAKPSSALPSSMKTSPSAPAAMTWCFRAASKTADRPFFDFAFRLRPGQA